MKLGITKVSNGYIVNTNAGSTDETADILKGLVNQIPGVFAKIFGKEGVFAKIFGKEEDPILSQLHEQDDEKEETQQGSVYVFKTLNQALEFCRERLDK